MPLRFTPAGRLWEPRSALRITVGRSRRCGQHSPHLDTTGIQDPIARLALLSASPRTLMSESGVTRCGVRNFVQEAVEEGGGPGEQVEAGFGLVGVGVEGDGVDLAVDRDEPGFAYLGVRLEAAGEGVAVPQGLAEFGQGHGRLQLLGVARHGVEVLEAHRGGLQAVDDAAQVCDCFVDGGAILR